MRNWLRYLAMRKFDLVSGCSWRAINRHCSVLEAELSRARMEVRRAYDHIDELNRKVADARAVLMDTVRREIRKAS